MEKENQRVRLTKRLLKESLMKLMEKKEISRISVSELCADAGINRTTFYNHYGSQFDVLEEMGHDLAEQIKFFGQEHNKNSGWALDKQVEEICTYLKTHRKEAVLIFENFTADSEIVEEIFKNRVTCMSDYKDSVQQFDAATQSLLNKFMLNGIYSLIRYWLIEDVNKSPADIGALALQLAQNGWLL